MPVCLPSVYLSVGARFLFWPGSGNLASAVKGGRSAEMGKRDRKCFETGGECIKTFRVTVIIVSL